MRLIIISRMFDVMFHVVHIGEVYEAVSYQNIIEVKCRSHVLTLEYLVIWNKGREKAE